MDAHDPPTPLHWGAESLWQQLAPLLPGLSVEVVERTTSTNSALLERARVVSELGPDGGQVQVHRSVESTAFGRRAVDAQPCLFVAEHQTSGRGRQGRVWHSAPGASLTFSLALPLAMADWSGLSLAVGVALCEALAPASTTSEALGPASQGGETLAPTLPRLPRIGLKWPNDLWLMDSPQSGRKLGGILIETVSAGSGRLAVIGVGLNVLPAPPHASVGETSTGFACLQELHPAASAPAALERVALPLVQALRLFEREGFAAFADRFAAFDVLKGQSVRTSLAEVAEGVAEGVSASGALLVRTPTGLHSVASGEVSVRLTASDDRLAPTRFERNRC